MLTIHTALAFFYEAHHLGFVCGDLSMNSSKVSFYRINSLFWKTYSRKPLISVIPKSHSGHYFSLALAKVGKESSKIYGDMLELFNLI